MEIRLGESIRKLRKEGGFTQEQLAEAMGVSVSAVHKWESDKATPELELLVDLAEFFETSVDAMLKAGKNVLCEGAQGGLLDIDHGTYPFVTSSSTVSGGACSGAGIPPRMVRDVWGVLKAYTTRVGEGPFPTELFDDNGENLRKVGNEYGATTGRPRRCGWFDAVASGYSCMISGVNKLAVTKLDVLDDLPELQICVAYELDGKQTAELPASAEDLVRVKPVYETLPGWQCSTSGVTSYDQLPENAKRYLARLGELVNAEIAIVSVGPRRDQTFEV